MKASAALLVLASVIAVAPASAQLTPDYLFRPGVVAITGSIGGAAFTAFHAGEARVRWAQAGAERSDDVLRRVSAQTTVAFSLSAAVWLSRSIGVRAHGSYAPTRFNVMVSQSDMAELQAGGLTPADGPGFARLGVWLYDLDLLVHPGVELGRVAPYAVLGAGMVRYRAHTEDGVLPAEAAAAFSNGTATSFAGVLGLGMVIPLERHRWLLTFELTDHLARSPLSNRWDGDDVEAAGLFMEPDPELVSSGKAPVTSNVRLMVGLTVPFAVSSER